MLLSKTVMVKITRGNYRFYKQKVKCEINDEILLPIELLARNAKEEIQYFCDYCLKEGKETIVINTYQNYMDSIERSGFDKDCCKNCLNIKKSELIKEKYGVGNISQIQEVKNKKIETCLEHFGVECNLTTDETKQKIRDTCMDKYGEDNPAKNKNVKEKAMRTNQNRYGVEWTSQSEQMKNNSIKTCLERYGVSHPMKNEEIKKKAQHVFIRKLGYTNPFDSKEIQYKIKKTIKEKYGVDNISQLEEIKIKKAETFYKNGTIATSRQQEYLWKLLGGELNYASNTPSLDIAFPNENIYIEFNGSGHDLCVYTGQMTREVFDNKEKRRYYYLKSKGWKAVFINSPQDYLPSDEIIIEEINKAKEWFQSNEKYHSHYNINIGNKINDSKYGKLRLIKEKDLKEVS